MTKFKLLSAGLITAAMLASPAMARENHITSHRDNADVAATGHYADGRVCQLAPRVGSFAGEPWDNGPPCEPETGF
ncbi:hypothetical protein ABIA99_004073 [Bradyrhizobium sp. LB12.1]